MNNKEQHPDSDPDNHNVYGSWPEVVEPCPSKQSPDGQHQYSIADNYIRCVHCKAESGL